MTLIAAPELVNLEAIRAAAAGLAEVAVRTPLIPVDTLAERLGVGVFVKAESLQRTGSFKLRGAYSAVRRLATDGVRGVVTYSSGNHGQAVAYVARRFGLRAVIVMPETVTPSKRRGVERWGAEVVLCGTTSLEREECARELAAERPGAPGAGGRALAVVPPFDHPDIIAGQGTVGLEIVADCPEVGTVVVPVGGGGLAAGVAAAVKSVRAGGGGGAGSGEGGASVAGGSEVRLVTVEPEGAPTLARALEAGRPVTLPRAASVADGLIPVRVGALPFALLAERVDRAVLVSDGAIRRAVRFALERLKLVLEPSGAATLAWLLECPPGAVDVGGPVVAVASGGNVEWAELCAVLAAEEAERSGGAAGAGHTGGEPA